MWEVVYLYKFDELAAIAEALQPTVICIVETWVSDQVTESEIVFFLMLQGYTNSKMLIYVWTLISGTY